MKSLISRSLLEHSRSLASKEYSSSELTLAYIDSIESQNDTLNAFITRNAESAILAARRSDERRSRGEALSAIDGIPYAAKDNISTKSIRTTCASKMLENYIPPYDATVIDRLALQGAVLLGKTNLDEFAMGISTETSCFGTSLNPLDPTCVAGGSSGGSAAAVAAKMAPFALGSDTGGSVRQPAAFCGIVGMRPTYGSVSRYGLISFAPSLDQIGPLTRSITDNALVMNAICGKDIQDETSRKHPCADFTEEIGLPLKGLRIAILTDTLDHEPAPGVKKALQWAETALRSLGSKTTELSLASARSAFSSYCVISCAEASSNLARFDGIRYGHRSENCDSIDALYRQSRSEGFGDEVKRRILFGTMALSSEYKSDFYINASKARARISAELCDSLEGVDALLLPTAPTEAYRVGVAQSLGFSANTDDIYCTLASLAGLPALSLPYQSEGSMPVGLQLVGKAFSEATLYRIAYGLEQEMAGGDSND